MKGSNETMEPIRADSAPNGHPRGRSPLKHPSPGVRLHSMDVSERMDEATFITSQADVLGETSEGAAADRVHAVTPDDPIRLAMKDFERGHKIEDKRNGAKTRNELERQPLRQLDLAIAKAGQPALKASAWVFSLSAKCTPDSTMDGTDGAEVSDPEEAGAGREQEESVEVVHERPGEPSGRVSLEDPTRGRDRRRGAQPRLEVVPMGFRAVSYTHLTLPTICSV